MFQAIPQLWVAQSLLFLSVVMAGRHVTSIFHGALPIDLTLQAGLRPFVCVVDRSRKALRRQSLLLALVEKLTQSHLSSLVLSLIALG